MIQSEQTARDELMVVIGGGIGGLATALALARKGYRVRLLEQAPEFKEIGAGIQLGPNAFAMFERLELLEQIARFAVYPENLIMMDSVSGEEVTRIPLGDPFEAHFGYPYAVIHRADLHRMLLAACERSTSVSLEVGRKVTSIEDHGDGVTVVTEDGRRFPGAAAVGADGLWSIVRSLLVNDGKPRISGHIAYRAVLPSAEMPERLRWNSMVLWGGEKTHLVQYPLRGGVLFNLVAVFHSSRYDEGWDSYGDPEELHERFAGTCSEVRMLLAKIESWRMWVLCDREPIKEWARGRVCLLGDAAHPMLQYLAQGACLAIEDAVCLADSLAQTADDVPRALAAYVAARYLRTGRAQIMARLYGEVYHAAGVTRELRNMLLSSRTPEQAYLGLEWLYRPSLTPNTELTQTLSRSAP